MQNVQVIFGYRVDEFDFSPVDEMIYNRVDLKFERELKQVIFLRIGI